MNPPHSQQRRLYLRVRDLARKLRRRQTPAEDFFWSKVRNRKLKGLKFDRQHIIQCPLDASFTKYYIADFYCHKLKLIVELDGPIHARQKELDLVRTEHMQERGYRVMRFLNKEVLEDWEGVVARIGELTPRPPLLQREGE